MKRREPLAYKNPNKAWVNAELEKLIQEWLAWQQEVAQLIDQPYDARTESEVFADGRDNMQKHEILQEKTRTFLDNNISGHGFIHGRDGGNVDRTDLRLRIRVEHRLQDLNMLRASLDYALVPEKYWKQKAKELIDKISDKGTDAAIDIAASYLRNPEN